MYQTTLSWMIFVKTWKLCYWNWTELEGNFEKIKQWWTRISPHPAASAAGIVSPEVGGISPVWWLGLQLWIFHQTSIDGVSQLRLGSCRVRAQSSQHLVGILHILGLCLDPGGVDMFWVQEHDQYGDGRREYGRFSATAFQFWNPVSVCFHMCPLLFGVKLTISLLWSLTWRFDV